MKFGLSDRVLNEINGVFASHPSVEKVVIYGSRAIGTHRNGSDIDLTLFGNTIDHTEITKIDIELEDLLLPYQFDLSLHSQIENSELLAHIKDMGKLFYAARPKEPGQTE